MMERERPHTLGYDRDFARIEASDEMSEELGVVVESFVQSTTDTIYPIHELCWEIIGNLRCCKGRSLEA